MGISNSITCYWFCVITKTKLVAGTLLAVLSYDHEKVTVADSLLKVLFRAVTDAGVPTYVIKLSKIVSHSRNKI